MHPSYLLYQEYFNIRSCERGESSRETNLTAAWVRMLKARTGDEFVLLVEQCVRSGFPNIFLETLVERMRRPGIYPLQDAEDYVRCKYLGIVDYRNDPNFDGEHSVDVRFDEYADFHLDNDVAEVWQGVAEMACGGGASDLEIGAALYICKFFDSRLLYEIANIGPNNPCIFGNLVPGNSLDTLKVSYTPVLISFVTQQMAFWDKKVESMLRSVG